jgi:hypothetical protein
MSNMWFNFIMLAAVLPDPEAIPVSVKLMSFDDPQREVAVLNAAGKPEAILLYSHSLTPTIVSQAKAGKFSIFSKPSSPDPKAPLRVLAAADLPPGEDKLIAILSGAGDSIRLNLIPDNSGTSAAGTLRFFNLCPKPVGLSLPGERQVIPAGKELVIHPKVKPSEYGQAQFFLPKEDEGWQVAGGLRWLQLEDIRSILFLLPAPGDPGIIVIRGVEERIAEEIKSPTAPAQDKKISKSKVLR